MPAVSAEALLISALVNTSEVGTEIGYGISAADFLGFCDEYNWLVNYVETYQSQPGWDVFKHKFADFRASDHTDIRSACDMVHHAANKRRITTAMSDAVDALRTGDADAAYQVLMEARPRQAVAQPRNLLTDTSHLSQWDHKPYAIELPYPTLQRMTGGIRSGNLWYLSARPGQGKSAHLCSIATNAVMTGNRVLFFSLEMSEEEVRARFHAALATRLRYSLTASALLAHEVDRATYKLFHAELAERLLEAGGALDVHTPVDGPVSPSTVASRAGEYDLCVVDYVGLMRADAGHAAITDWRVMAEISNSLKYVAESLPTRLLCAAQINREGDTGANPPKLKNLAQSDALGQDGDVVLTMRMKPKNVATHFSLEKNRHGPSGTHFFTTFDPNSGVYTEISGDHAEDLVINAEALAEAPINPPRLRVIRKDES